MCETIVNPISKWYYYHLVEDYTKSWCDYLQISGR
jgi:hypothetical protein